MEEVNDSSGSREGFGVSRLGFRIYGLVISEFFLLLSFFSFFFFFKITHKKR